MLPLLGLIMAMALLSGVFSVDIGLIYDGREEARMAADMAALAGVQELPGDQVEAVRQAVEYAALNGYDECGDQYDGPSCENSGVSVTAVVMTGPTYDPIACIREGYCMNVTVTREWHWLFGNLLTLPPVTITASAISQLGAQPRDVMVVLETSGSMCDDFGRGNPGYCQDASKASLVGLDMSSSSSANAINFGTSLSALTGMNVPFVLPPAASTYSFTINGVSFTYAANSNLNAIVAAINAQSGATSVTASLSNTNGNHTLTLTKTLFGVAPTIAIDDIEPGNFFRATRMLGDPQPTKLSGNDVDSALNTVNYPADLGVPLMNLNSTAANFDVDFIDAIGVDSFCIQASGHVAPAGDPCQTGAFATITYNPATESMTTVLNRINTTPAAGVCATFAGDVFTLNRGSMSGSVCTPALGPIPLTIADINGNFFQAVKLLQVPTYSTAVGLDIADCVGPPSGTNSDTCFNTDDLGGAPANATLAGLNDELAVDLVPGSGAFVVNGCTVNYASSDSLNAIATRIGTNTNAACSTGNGGPVTATLQVGSDTFLLTSTTLGDQPITYNDVVTNDGVGNFLQSMKFITPIRRTELRGLDVEGSLGSGFDTGDLTVPLRDLDGELQVDFERGSGLQFCINATGNPCIGGGGNNGVLITYDAPAAGNGDTLQTVIDKINNPANGTGVIATIDPASTDRMILRRNAYGSSAITVADVTGNFLHAMQILGGSYSRVTGLRVSECNNCDVDNNEMSANLDDIDGEMLVDVLSVTNGQFVINGAPVFYDATNDSLNDVISRINNPASGTGVTASFLTNDNDSATRDRFTLLQNTPGAQDIAFADINGNFLQAMRLLAGGTNESIRGGDVGDLSSGNLGANVGTLTGGQLTQTFAAGPGRFLINDLPIDYNPSNDTLTEIMNRIGSSAAGVTATFDTGTDQLTLTRSAPGNMPITFSDFSGNFFRAMQFYSGGSVSTAVGADIGNLSSGNVTSNLVTLTSPAQITLPFNVPAGGAGSFFVNGKLITYDVDNDTLQEVMDRIAADVDAGVTATFNVTTDQMTLTRNAPGNLDITFGDNVGNFLHVMQFVSGSLTRWVGLDVADCADDGGGNACNIDPAGGSGSEMDDTLDGINGDLTVDLLSVTNGSFTVNGQTITYNTSTDTINSVVGKINDPLNETGVYAVFDPATDRLTLQATASGPAPINAADGSGSNFLQAMRMISPTTYASVTGLDFGSSFDSDDLDDPLSPNLNDELTVDVQPTIPSQFTINGVTLQAFDPSSFTLDDIKALIDASAADVVATFDVNNDTLTLTRKTAGNLPITFSDNTGNFLQAMRLLSPGTFESIEGLDVGSSFQLDDTNNPLRDLNSSQADFTVDFTLSNATQNFVINGVTINYCARSDNNNCTGPTMSNSTLDSIATAIAASAAGVTASYDENSDSMTLTRTVAGPNPITLANGTGNFLQAMRFMSAGTFSTLVGLDVAECGGCDISPSNGGNDDPDDQLIDLNEELSVPFAAGSGSFTVNGTLITYNTASDTLNSVLNKINNGAGGVGPVPDVTASFDANDPDVMRFVRDTAGNLSLDIVDVTGNFLRAMRLITQSGGTQSTVSGGDVGTLVNATGGNLNALDAFLDVDVQRVSNGSFLVNGASVSYNALNDTLAEVMTSIGTTPGTGVTAAFIDGGNFFRLTAVAPGSAPITFSDVTGNFLEAMKLATSTRVALQGPGFTDCGSAACFDVGDLTDTIGNLNDELQVNFVTTGSFSINGGPAINYTAASTLASIRDAINASTSGVVAIINPATDTLRLERTAPGPLAPITVSDLSGNFFQAMGFLAGGSRRTAVGYSVGTLTQAQLDYPLQMNGSFTIRGVNFTSNPANPESIQDILDRINGDAAADVTATFDLATGRLTVTRDTIGGAGPDLTFSGAFMHSMGMVSGAAASTTIAGGDVGTGFDQASDFDQRLSSLNGGFGSAASFSTDFNLTDSPRTFSINGQSITYCPRQSFFGGYTCDGSAPSAANSHSTLNTIRASIDLVANGTGVTAVIDVGSADQMTLTRSVTGPLPIVVADGPNGANFLDAMQMLDGVTTLGAIASGTGAALSGAAPSGTLPTLVAAPIAGTTPTYVASTPGTPPVVSYANKTLGANGGGLLPGVIVTPGAAGGGPLGGITVVVGVIGGAHLGTETSGVNGIDPAPEDYDCQNLPGSDVVTLPGDVLCGGAVTPNVTTVAGTDPVAVLVVMGVDAVVTPVLGVVPPLPLNNPCPAFTSQCRIAVLTPGLDATDIRGDLSLGDDINIGHLIATFTLSNHRPLDVPPVDFWRPFGEVQRAASHFSRLPVFAPEFDQMGLVGFADVAGVPDLVKPPTDLIHECETSGGAAIANCLVPNVPLGHNFGVPPSGFSGFELEMLELQAEGSTNTGAGICVALNDLRNPTLGHGQAGADKVIVLLSDGAPTAVGQPGCPTVGTNPGTPAHTACSAYAQSGNVPTGNYEYVRYMACLAREAGVTIHTIGLSLANQQDAQLLQDVASITGGSFFAATPDDDPVTGLTAQFENVANILAIALTK